MYTIWFLIIKCNVRQSSIKVLGPLLPLLLTLSGSNEKPKPGKDLDSEKVLRIVKDFKQFVKVSKLSLTYIANNSVTHRKNEYKVDNLEIK